MAHLINRLTVGRTRLDGGPPAARSPRVSGRRPGRPTGGSAASPRIESGGRPVDQLVGQYAGSARSVSSDGSARSASSGSTVRSSWTARLAASESCASVCSATSPAR